ncbi:Class B secretin-like G-protein coupled receptor GPRmth6, putative [Gryllus bimaculatus]|nr:Class B secretin-like G-protein coupled receptor GPRmth6, putative [Gryllus bimaculatus]
MPVTLLLLIAAVGVSGVEAVVPAPAAGELLLRKCCPAHQQLSGALDACVEVSDGPPLWDASTVEDASALLELSAGGVPWWLDGDLLLLEADGSPPAAAGPFLAGQPAGARVGYGAHPICARFDRLFVPTFARDRVALLRDGRLRLALRGGGDPGRFVLLPPEDYCVDRVAAPPTPKRPNTFVAMACPCARAVCVRKCCANSQNIQKKA